MSRFQDCVSLLKYPQILTCQDSKTVFLNCNTPRYSHVKIHRLCFYVVIPQVLTCQDSIPRLCFCVVIAPVSHMSRFQDCVFVLYYPQVLTL